MSDARRWDDGRSEFSNMSAVGSAAMSGVAVSTRTDAASAVAMADAAMESARRATTSRPRPGSRAPPKPGSAEFVKNSPGRGLVAPLSPGRIGRSTPQDLDLPHNDNAFHVVANLIKDRLESRVLPGATSYTVTQEDAAYFDQMLPRAIRENFVQSLRTRISSCPPEDSVNQTPIHVLARECQQLGLNRDVSVNPILVDPSRHGGSFTVNDIHLTSRDGGVRHSASMGNNYALADPPHMTRFTKSFGDGSAVGGKNTATISLDSPQIFRSPPSPKKSPLSDLFASAATFGGSPRPQTVSALSEAHVSTTESLARQQLMAELKEATTLMSESKTPEAANFWKSHVVELQVRLRALHGETSPPRQGSSSGGVGGGAQQSRSFSQPPGAPQAAPQKAPPSVDAQEKLRAFYGGADPSSPYYQSRESYMEANQRMADRHQQQLVPPSQQQQQQLQRTRSAESQLRQAASKHEEDLPVVDVVSPADLPEGYQFEAQLGSKRFLATVPPGGAKKGETFSCYMRNLDTIEMEAPEGHWRDGIFDCAYHGFSHPLFLNTLFCPLVSLGQIMTRTGLNWLGYPSLRTRQPFVMLLTIISFWIGMNIMAVFVIYWKVRRGLGPSPTDIAALGLINVVMYFFSVYVTSATRASLRAKYSIPEDRCFDLEDLMCGIFCLPCSVCQMGRHTADYDTYIGVCCSETGMPAHVKLAGASAERRASHQRGGYNQSHII